MSLLGVLQLLLLAVSCFAALTSLASAVAYPLLRKRIACAAPETRARVLTAWLLAPMGFGLLLGGLCLAPSAASLVWPAYDHCAGAVHAHHAHVCLAHAPAASGGLLGWIAIGAALVFLALAWRRPIAAAIAARRLIRRLLASAVTHGRLGAKVVDADRVFAIAAGSHTLVSRRLIDALGPSEIDAVIAHEEAHLARRDALRKLLARLGAVAHVQPIRGMMIADLDLAIEQSCDERAALVVGDRLVVARAILAVERLFHEPPLPAPSFSGANLIARVEALLAPRRRPRPLAKDTLVLAVALVALLPTSHPLHHAIEHVVSLFA